MSRLTELCESAGNYLAASPNYEASRIVLLGAPMDYTVSFRPGSRSGPQAIRQASYGLEEYSIYTRKDLTQVRFFDAGDIALPVGDPVASLARIEEAVESIVTGHKFPLLLGGEHLVSLGALRALSRHYQGLAVVHLDAHADLRTDYLGVAHSHASVMYHAHRELELELYQFGIRSATADELEYANKYTHFYPFHVLEPLKTTLDSLRGRPVYFSLDIDVADPAFAPGTGTPEPGGITSAELLEVAALLGRLQLVGMDLVEVSPVYDLAGITAMLAAKVIREIILLQG